MTQELPNLETCWVSQEASPFGLEWQVWPSSLCSSPPTNWIRLLPRIILCVRVGWREAVEVCVCVSKESVKIRFKIVRMCLSELTLTSDNRPIYFPRERTGNVACALVQPTGPYAFSYQNPEGWYITQLKSHKTLFQKISIKIPHGHSLGNYAL